MRAATAGLALALTLVASASEAASKLTFSHTRLHGEAAFAFWQYTEGNIFTLVSVALSEDHLREHAKGQPNRLKVPIATVAVHQTDLSDFRVLIEGVMDAEDFEFDVSPDLSEGYFRANGLFQDFSTFTFFDMTANLIFQATGEISPQNGPNIISEPGFKQISRSVGLFRPAQAMGSISARGQEFIPVPSSWAELQRNRFAELIIEMTRPGAD